MPALLHRLNYTYADYLGFEASSNVKHEFLDEGETVEVSIGARLDIGELYAVAAEPSAPTL